MNNLTSPIQAGRKGPFFTDYDRPMKAVVTGAAGFIGSNLAQKLLRLGWSVSGIDCLTDYYDLDQKNRNIQSLREYQEFRFVNSDLLGAGLDGLVDGVDVVFHQAGQPGVRSSWSSEFCEYSRNNIEVTHRVLESVRKSPGTRLVYASSSSVYGNTKIVPTPESSQKSPFSPYGVTKYAGELLCNAYAENFSTHVVSLRYFTVYGPRQRPDMAIYRMIQAALNQTPFLVYGDGTNIRDFTYVDDVVEANIAAAKAAIGTGLAFNIAGGASITVGDLLAKVGNEVGVDVPVIWKESLPGDVRQTGGDITASSKTLGWKPLTSLEDGLRTQVEWQRKL